MDENLHFYETVVYKLTKLHRWDNMILYLNSKMMKGLYIYNESIGK